MTDLLAQLRALLGAEQVLTGADLAGRGWGGRPLQAKALLRPGTAAEVSAVVRLCHAQGQALVTHGGLTGLVGGAAATSEQLVLSTARLNQIEAINVADRTACVQAGVPLQQLQEAVDAQGLLLPLDLGARGSATIGGNIATNAGGNRVIRFGMTRDMILGLEVVLADGTLVTSMNQIIKNNAGYDLKQLFIGSEGTLGIVTRAIIRLREKPKSQQTVFVATNSFTQVQAFLRHMDAHLGGTLSAFEVMWRDFYELVTTPPAKQQPPLAYDWPFYVLVESMGAEPVADQARMEAALASALEAGLITDAVVAHSEAQRQALWAMRDDVGQLGRLAPGYTFDVSVRLSHMQAYVDEVNSRLTARFPGCRNMIFGHLGDGNLHFYVAPNAVGAEVKTAVERAVYEPLASHGGSVSAEHGIGHSKKAYLHLSRSPEEIALMRLLKQTLDPKGILNPGLIF